MRDEDLDRIEATLGVKLPPKYRATMRAYPFPADSSAAELWSPPDADWVIRTSREWGESGLYDRPWSSRYVALGGDGGERGNLPIGFQNAYSRQPLDSLGLLRDTMRSGQRDTPCR